MGADHSCGDITILSRQAGTAQLYQLYHKRIYDCTKYEYSVRSRQHSLGTWHAYCQFVTPYEYSVEGMKYEARQTLYRVGSSSTGTATAAANAVVRQIIATFASATLTHVLDSLLDNPTYEVVRSILRRVRGSAFLCTHTESSISIPFGEIWDSRRQRATRTLNLEHHRIQQAGLSTQTPASSSPCSHSIFSPHSSPHIIMLSLPQYEHHTHLVSSAHTLPVRWSPIHHC